MDCPHCGDKLTEEFVAGGLPCPACGRDPRIAPAAAAREQQKTLNWRLGESRTARFGQSDIAAPEDFRPDQVKTPVRAPADDETAAPTFPRSLGPFQIRGKLGEGGMGLVLDGYDPSLDRRVAVKVLWDRFARDAQLVQRFLAEARAIAKVSHPNVASIYFAGSEGNRHFFAIEFVGGGSLDDMIERGGALPPSVAVGYVLQATRGLSAAFQQNIIHRDVKPANLLLTEKKEVKVTDFGLAKMTDQSLKLTQTGDVMGSPHFMSPEQGRGDAVDFRADIYSLGASLYYLVVGSTPYHGDSAVALIYKHQEEPVPQVANAPASLNRLIGRMMAKDPRDRYASYEALIADLEHMIKGGVLTSRPVEAATSAKAAAPTAGIKATPVTLPPRAPIVPPAAPRPADPPAWNQAGERDGAARLEAILRIQSQAGATPEASATVVPIPPRPAARSGTTAVARQDGGAAGATAILGRLPKKYAVAGGAAAALLVVAALLAWAIGGRGPGTASEKDEGPEVRRRVSMLAEVLDDPSPLVRKDAVAALGRIAGPSAENLIVMALRDEDPSIRVEAASTLGDRRDKGLGAVPEDTVCARLADLLLDESADVRVVTASVLQSLTRYDFAGVDWRDGEAVWREAAAEKFADWLSRGRPSGE